MRKPAAGATVPWRGQEGSMRTATATQYRTRMARALRYIDAHLADDLTLELLSDVAAFSKFHFHRQFFTLLGISVHNYVQLSRLKQASYNLAFRTDEPITEIALACGYAAPEAFSRAFRDRVGQTPSDFRKQPDWPLWHAAFRPLNGREKAGLELPFQPGDVEIIDVGDTRVAMLEHRGDPSLIGDSVRRFIAWRKEAGLSPGISATFNIWYDDPETTPPGAFRLGLCAATEREIAPNEFGIAAAIIPGGRCAVLRSVGSDESLREAATCIYAKWLPESGEELRDFPPYCQRIVLVPDVTRHQAVTDIFVPLK